MIANIIPAIRTPRSIGAGGFDYEIPEGLEIRVGDLVRIPFRKSSIVGLVSTVHSTTDIKTPLKPIIGFFFDLHLPEIVIPLLEQLSERSFTSPSSVLHSWLGVLPKRDTKKNIEDRGQKRERTLIVNSSRINLPSPVVFLPDSLHHPQGLIAKAKSALNRGERVLVISPWSARAEKIAEELSDVALTGELSAGKRFRLWSNFLNGTTSILITTRIGAWCGIGADMIIIDEPENDDHKQDEMSPRYDARWISAYLQSKGVQLELIGTTPRLTQIAHNDIEKPENIPSIHADVVYVDVHRADWSDIPSLQCRSLLVLESGIKQKRPILIIHPIHGEQSRLRCKDCEWSAVCEACGAGTLVEKGSLYCRRCNHRSPLIITCPACGGTQFAFSKPGRLKLTDAMMNHHFENVSTLSVGEWNAISSIPKNSVVILTDITLLAGAREDLRRTEQTLIAWRRLADRCASAQSTLVVQGDPSTLTRAKEWLEGKGCLIAFQKELAERKTFHLPPTARLVKLIFRGNQDHAVRTLDSLRVAVKNIPEAVVLGPFMVKFRPSHREARWIGHLSTPTSTPLQNVIRAIGIVANQTDTLIDLDPIAFYE